MIYQPDTWYPSIQHKSGWSDVPPTPKGFKVVVEQDWFLGLPTRFKFVRADETTN